MSHEKNTPMNPLDAAIAALRTKRDQIDAAIAAIEAVRSARAISAPKRASEQETEDDLLEDAVNALDAPREGVENVTQFRDPTRASST